MTEQVAHTILTDSVVSNLLKCTRSIFQRLVRSANCEQLRDVTLIQGIQNVLFHHAIKLLTFMALHPSHQFDTSYLLS
jgi:hypothetical protein